MVLLASTEQHSPAAVGPNLAGQSLQALHGFRDHYVSIRYRNELGKALKKLSRPNSAERNNPNGTLGSLSTELRESNAVLDPCECCWHAFGWSCAGSDFCTWLLLNCFDVKGWTSLLHGAFAVMQL